ncbi:hypothetical protein UPYG_G00248770 [Umbra pygmaea]|uniref:AIG1-type G domain-containing protein n=1 Tax=Umbra pygmaea TaxID=75934 RepID=A0ABD0W759_UMBPY
MLSVSLCPPGPHTLLLVIRGDTSFTEEHRRGIEEHLDLLSELVWSHTIVLFTRGDCLGDTTIELHIESEGKALQWLVEKCGNRYHVLNNKNRGDRTQVTELLEKIEEMVALNSGDHFVIYPSIKIRGHRQEADFSSQTASSGILKRISSAWRNMKVNPSLKRKWRSREILPPSLSGDSRAETGFDSEQMSVCGSVDGSQLGLERLSFEEMWKKPSLPIKGAGSMEFIPPSWSGDSRAESGFDSEQMSVCGSVDGSQLGLERLSFEEMWKKPSLPIKGAGSMEFIPPSLSGDSRRESGFGSDQMSEGGSVDESLLNPKR